MATGCGAVCGGKWTTSCKTLKSNGMESIIPLYIIILLLFFFLLLTESGRNVIRCTALKIYLNCKKSEALRVAWRIVKQLELFVPDCGIFRKQMVQKAKKDWLRHDWADVQQVHMFLIKWTVSVLVTFKHRRNLVPLVPFIINVRFSPPTYDLNN